MWLVAPNKTCRQVTHLGMCGLIITVKYIFIISFSFFLNYNLSSLLLIEPRVCVCVCAKFDQFLPLRSHFVSKPPENFVRIAKFPYAAFGPLFAFHCPLFFTRNNHLECNRHASPLRHSRCFRSECGCFTADVATGIRRWRH